MHLSNVFLQTKIPVSYEFFSEQTNIENFYITSIIIGTDEDPSLRIESSVIINLCGVSTKLYFILTFTMQTYKELLSSIFFKIGIQYFFNIATAYVLSNNVLCICGLIRKLKYSNSNVRH